MFETNPFYSPAAGNGMAAQLSSEALGMLIAAAVVAVFLLFRTLRRDGHAPPDPDELRRSMHIPERQLPVVAEAEFETTPILNAAERRILPVIEQVVARHGRGHRVMAQTSLGELLRARPVPGKEAVTKAAFAAINCKRFDFAIIDAHGRLVIAIEYQGGGHYSRTAFMRDAVKREVCRKAGVAFIEVKRGMRPSELTDALRDLLAPSAPVSTAAE